MPNLAPVEIKAFVPAKDFDVSKQFYTDLCFDVVWSTDDLAYLRRDGTSFLLQRFYEPKHASNFMMHLLVEDADAWFAHVQASDVAGRYGVRLTPIEDRPWGLREFTLDDPTGVLWRIGHELAA